MKKTTRVLIVIFLLVFNSSLFAADFGRLHIPDVAYRLAEIDNKNVDIYIYYDKLEEHWNVGLSAYFNVDYYLSKFDDSLLLLKPKGVDNSFLFKNYDNTWTLIDEDVDIFDYRLTEIKEPVNIKISERRLLTYRNGLLTKIHENKTKRVEIRGNIALITDEVNQEKATAIFNQSWCPVDFENSRKKVRLSYLDNSTTCELKSVFFEDKKTGEAVSQSFLGEDVKNYKRELKSESFTSDSRLGFDFSEIEALKSSDGVYEKWSNGVQTFYSKDSGKYFIGPLGRRFEIDKSHFSLLRATLKSFWVYPTALLVNHTVRKRSCVDCVLMSETEFSPTGNVSKKELTFKSGLIEVREYKNMGSIKISEHVYIHLNDTVLKEEHWEYHNGQKRLTRKVDNSKNKNLNIGELEKPYKFPDLLSVNDSVMTGLDTTQWTTSCDSEDRIACTEQCRRNGGVNTCRSSWINRLTQCRDSFGNYFACYQTFKLKMLCSCWGDDDDISQCPVN